MPVTPMDPNDLGARLSEIERQLRDLSSGSGLRNASMREGTLTIRDETGEPMVLVGRFEDGSYGLGVLDGAGNFVSIQNYIFGLQTEEVETSEGTSSTSYTDLATSGPEVTVNVGPSGRVIVDQSAFIGLGAGGMSATAGVYVDGVLGPGILGLSCQTTDPIASTVGGRRLISGLSEGPHVFLMRYKVSASSATFSNRVLTVQPI